MKRELELELVKRYPNLFRDYGGDMRRTCMFWGMSHGDGWYGIIDEIGEQLIKLGTEDKVIADQVKEKFGGLRFYYHVMGGLSKDIYKKIDDIINEAEEESYKTCESCGSKENVTVNETGWTYTLCDKCREKMKRGVE